MPVDTTDAPAPGPEPPSEPPSDVLSCALRSCAHMLRDAHAVLSSFRDDPRDLTGHLSNTAEALAAVSTMLWRAHARVEPALDPSRLRAAAEHVDAATTCVHAILVVVSSAVVLDEGDRSMALGTMADTFAIEGEGSVDEAAELVRVLLAEGVRPRTDLN